MTGRTLDIGYFTLQESARLQQKGIDSTQGTYSVVDLLKAGVIFTNVVGPAMVRGLTKNIKPIFDAMIPYGEKPGKLDLSRRRILFVEELDAILSYQGSHRDYITHNGPQDISDRMEQILHEALKMREKEQELQMKVAIDATKELMTEHQDRATDYREFWLGSDEKSQVQYKAGATFFTLQELFSNDIKLNRINGISYEIVINRIGALYQGSPFLNSNSDLSQNIDVTFYVSGSKKRLNKIVVELARHGLSQMNEGLVCYDSDQIYLTMKEFEELFMTPAKPLGEKQGLIRGLPLTRDEMNLVKSRLEYRVDAWVKLVK